MTRDAYEKFSSRTIALHWIVAITFIGLLAVGLYMEDLPDGPGKFQLYGLHKSIGMLLFPIALYRIFWRMANGFPEPVGSYSSIEHALAKIVHYVLILGTVLMPISGMMMSGAGGHGLAIFGMELVAANYVDGEAVALSGAAAEAGHVMHGLGSNLIIAALALHVVGALKHHVVDKDATLRRMFGGRAAR